MGRASSAKKVARAARAAGSGGGRSGERRAIGFPALIAVIVVLGLLLVVYARSSRTAEAHPSLNDYWTAAYMVYDCVDDQTMPIFTSTAEGLGIHSHQDGLVHIHPRSDTVTGDGAQLEVFMAAMAADITEDYIELPGGTRLEAGVECDGGPAVIQVLRWSDAFSANDSDPSDVYTEAPGNVKFERDAEAFVIARAPLGFEPPPFSQNQLELLRDSLDEEPEPVGVVPTPLPGAPDPSTGLAPPSEIPTDGTETDGTDGTETDGTDGTDGADGTDGTDGADGTDDGAAEPTPAEDGASSGN